MWRGVDCVIVLTLFGLYSFCENINDELNEENDLSYEYKQIFSGIPSLTEYIFNAVEEHPEILEKNDVTMFKKTAEEGDQIFKYNKRSLKSITEENYVLKDEEYEEEKCVNNFEPIESETNKVEVTYEFKDINTKEYKYDNLMLMIGLKEDVCEMKPEREVRHYKSEDLFKDNQVERKKLCNKDKNDFQDSNDVDWKVDAYPGFKSFLSLDVTPEEIEESHIMTERLLEEYNRNN